VAQNEVVLRGLTLDGLRYAFTSTDMGNWHPLTWLSHLLVAQLWGAAPAAHHLGNLVLHLASVLLLFFLLLRTTGAALPSALAAGLFAVHPLRVESVAWVAERKDVLSTSFWLLALHAWVRWAEGHRVRWYLATVAAFAAGLMSKPMLVTLPFTLLLFDIWPLGRWRPLDRAAGLPLGRLALEKLPLLALSAVSCAATLWAQRSAGAMEFGDTIDLVTRGANAVRSVGIYLVQTLWPAHLAVWYPYPQTIPWVQVALAAAVIVALSAACAATFERAPWLLVGWLWFLGTLVPVLGLVQVGNQAHADRYTYVPHLGLCAALAWGLAALARGPTWRGLLVGGLSCGALAGSTLATSELTRSWRDNSSLFAQAAVATRNNTLAHDHLAHALQLEGRLAEAVQHYREVVRIRPDLATAQVNLGLALEQQGDVEGALRCFERAIELDPATANAWSNIGVILGRRGRPEEAAQKLERALELAPDKPGLLLNAALNDLMLGRTRNAALRFRRAAELDRAALAHPEALRLAWILSTDPDDAVRDGALARRIAEQRLAASGGGDLDALEVLAAAQAECGGLSEALATIDRALELARAQGAEARVTRLETERAQLASGRPLHIR